MVIEIQRTVTVVTGSTLVTTVSNAAGPQGATGAAGPTGPSGSADPWLGSSGVLYGMELSINGGDNTKIDIAAGKARVLNLDDAENPVWVEVELVSPLLAVELPDIATTIATSIFIDRFGAVQRTSLPVEPPEGRQFAYLGVAPHPFGTVTAPVNNATMVASRGGSDRLIRRLGEVNLEGNRFTPNVSPGSNMLLDRSEGKTFGFGSNRAGSVYNQDERASSARTEITSYLQSWRGATPSAPYNLSGVTEIPADVIDNGTGVLAALGNNRWVLHCIRYAAVADPSIQTIIEIGQNEYSNLPDAIAGRADPVSPNPLFSQIARRTWIAVKKGTTQLGSVDVQFIHVPDLDLGNSAIGGELA